MIPTSAVMYVNFIDDVSRMSVYTFGRSPLLSIRPLACLTVLAQIVSCCFQVYGCNVSFASIYVSLRNHTCGAGFLRHHLLSQKYDPSPEPHCTDPLTSKSALFHVAGNAALIRSGSTSSSTDTRRPLSSTPACHDWVSPSPLDKTDPWNTMKVSNHYKCTLKTSKKLPGSCLLVLPIPYPRPGA